MAKKIKHWVCINDTYFEGKVWAAGDPYTSDAPVEPVQDPKNGGIMVLPSNRHFVPAPQYQYPMVDDAPPDSDEPETEPPEEEQPPAVEPFVEPEGDSDVE
ncbi:MAG: hypothetical protein PVJ39_21280, partial [Gammaproteobacteria bacterium]